MKERGQVRFYNLGNRITELDLERIKPHLLPVLQAWEVREREHHLLSLAESVGRRLKAFPELIDVLERMVHQASHSYLSARALDIIAEHRPSRMAELVPVLLRKDPTWITQPAVHMYLHLRRQNLLTPYLGTRKYAGRFSTGRTTFVLPLRTGFYRWTPTQQKTFAQTLSRVVGDSVRDTPAVLATVGQLANMEMVPPDRVIQLAGDPRQPVRDGAVRALGRLDAGEGVPVLVAILSDNEDDRSRIAIYALRSVVLEMPVARAMPLLREVPLEKVTVAKEVIRLVGELRGDEAYQYLQEVEGRDLHRDVRVALLRALWLHLELPETWAILERAARGEDEAIATMAGRTPADRLSRQAQARLCGILSLLLDHRDPKVRLDVLQRIQTMPVPDRGRVLRMGLLRAMGSHLPDESRAATEAVLATYAEDQAGEMGSAVEQLLPNRRAISDVVNALIAQLRSRRGRLLGASRAVVAALARDPATVRLRLELAVEALPWSESRQLLEGAATADELHSDALAAAEQAIERTAHRSDAHDLPAFEAALSGSADERLRRLALAAVVAQAAGPTGWSAELRSRLEDYRRDPSLLVRSAAEFTFPPPDGQAEPG